MTSTSPASPQVTTPGNLHLVLQVSFVCHSNSHYWRQIPSYFDCFSFWIIRSKQHLELANIYLARSAGRIDLDTYGHMAQISEGGEDSKGM